MVFSDRRTEQGLEPALAWAGRARQLAASPIFSPVSSEVPSGHQILSASFANGYRLAISNPAPAEEIDEKRSNGRLQFKSYPIGFFRLNIAEVRTGAGKLYLFVVIDRTSKLAFARLVDTANRATASAFLLALIKVVPYKVHTVLTDNGVQFCCQSGKRGGAVHDAHVLRRTSKTQSVSDCFCSTASTASNTG